MQLFFAITLFVSASLLFVVQPMFAKMVLPRLGGTPAVWNTCMVFYQAALLGGYVYAHLGSRWLGARRQAWVHVLLMLAPWLVLPICVRESWSPPAESNPIPALLLLLSLGVGLPFFVVSASAPMLQSWFAHTGHASAKDPYFLYAASNLGSMLALLGYPFVIEPQLTLFWQGWAWAIGYGLLMVLTVGCAAILWRARGGPEPSPTLAVDPEPAETLGWGRRLRWVALAFIPSSLLLGVTTHISIDLAAVPLLWIVPLTLYLLTFVFVFAQHQILRHDWMVRLQPFLLLPLALIFFDSGTKWFWWIVVLHLTAFFVTAMVCHGELARTRPHSSRLTEFYLWMSLGGVLGGSFNAILAPTLFPWIGDRLWVLLYSLDGTATGNALGKIISPNVFYMVLEYPLMIAAACLLRPRMAWQHDTRTLRWIVFGVPSLLVMAAGVFLLVLRRNGTALDHRWKWSLDPHTLHLTPMTVTVAVAVVIGVLAAVAAALAFWPRKSAVAPDDPPLARDRSKLPWTLVAVASLLAVGAGTMLLTCWALDAPASGRWEWTLPGRSFGLTPQMVILMVFAAIAMVFMARPFWFGTGLAIVLVVGFWFADPFEHVIFMKRSFFGVMRVSSYQHDAETASHRLAHGSTTHGLQIQFADPEERDRPQSYYFPNGPLGDIFFKTANRGRRQHVAVVGLGTGSTAGYSQYNRPERSQWVTGPQITYFEIDPEVKAIAEDPKLFTYLTDCKELFHVNVNVVLGDARLRLADFSDGTFDLIAVDAFSSDSIPIHLLTQQAVALYMRKLKPDGVLAVHVSNRYLDLEPLVARLAEAEGLACRARQDNDVSDEDEDLGKYSSDWVAVAREEKHLGELVTDTDTEWRTIEIPDGTPCWTDDFSNIIAALHRR